MRSHLTAAGMEGGLSRPLQIRPKGTWDLPFMWRGSLTVGSGTFFETLSPLVPVTFRFLNIYHLYDMYDVYDVGCQT